MRMDLSFLSEYFMPVIIGVCLCVGYIVKKWIRDVDNKFIPTINAVLGIALALAMNWGNISVGTVLGGMISGLAATGLHQAFKQLIEGKQEELQNLTAPGKHGIIAVRRCQKTVGGSILPSKGGVADGKYNIFDYYTSPYRKDFTYRQ